MEVVCSGSGNRFVANDVTRGSGQEVVVSVWLKVVSGTPAFRLSIWTTNFATQLKASGAMTPVQTIGAWNRYVLTATDAELSGNLGLKIILDDVNGSPATWRVDGAQVEAGREAATPYVETNGVTASRLGARVYVPASPTPPINETQSWLAARVRMGAASGRDPHGGGNGRNLVLFEWSTNTINRLRLSYQPTNNVPDNDKWRLDRTLTTSLAGVYSAVQSFSAGADVTVIAAWTATTLYLSINGAAFVSAASTEIPVLQNVAPIEIGSGGLVGGGREFDGDVHWVAAGRGTLSNSDAATIHAFGNTDPTLPALPGTPTFVWDAASSAYVVPGTSLLVPAPVIQPYGMIFPGSDSYPGSDVYPAAVPSIQLANAAMRSLNLTEA